MQTFKIYSWKSDDSTTITAKGLVNLRRRLMKETRHRTSSYNPYATCIVQSMAGDIYIFEKAGDAFWWYSGVKVKANGTYSWEKVYSVNERTGDITAV